MDQHLASRHAASGNTGGNIGASVVAFIGGGNMASALIGGLLRSGHAVHDLEIVEPLAEQRARLHGEFGVHALAQAGPSLQRARIVVWAVKPQLFTEAARPCQPWVRGALQLSVMAGVRCAAVQDASGSAHVVRAMPNTPALIGRGIAGLFAQASVNAVQRQSVEALLAPTGATLWVEQEALLDAVTALSGSGPAYVFYVVEAMIAAGTAMGLSEAQSRQLSLATFDGAAELARRSSASAQELRAQVTSKGGTTHAAITTLDAQGVHQAFVQALHAAAARAKEMGDAFGGSS